jgi:hypothetical protein
MSIGTNADWSSGTPTATGGLWNLLQNFLPTAAQAGLTYAAGQQGIKDLQSYGRELRQGAEQGAQQIMEGSTFRPFTVTTGLSTAQTDPTGGYSLNLSPEQQFYQDELFGTAAGMLQRATEDQTTREQKVFDRMQAMMAPQQERERLALEERLQGQGRLGVRTSMFGGTPEQFAMSKAQEEAKNTAAIQAMQQAMAQQGQEAQIGSGLFQMGYLPTQQAMASLAPGINMADIAGALQRQGIQAGTALQQSGLESDVGLRAAASAAEQNMFQTLLNISSQALGVNQGQQSQQGMLSSLADLIKGLGR